MSDATSSLPESDYEDEAEPELSDRDRGGFEQSEPPRKSTSVPIPVAQFEQMEDTDDPAPESASLTPEPMVVVPYDPDVIVEQVEEVELEPELASPDKQEQPAPLHKLSRGTLWQRQQLQWNWIVMTCSRRRNWSQHNRLKKLSGLPWSTVEKVYRRTAMKLELFQRKLRPCFSSLSH